MDMTIEPLHKNWQGEARPSEVADPCTCSARGYWFRCKCGQAICHNCGKHYDDTPKGVVGNV